MTKFIEGDNLSLARQYFASAIASFGCVCAGTVLAWTSPVLPQLLSGNDLLVISESEGGMAGSMAAIGAMVSALPAGYVADRFGRKTTLSYLTLPFLAGWIIAGLSKQLGVMFVARFLGGFASGAICVCVPMYVSEIASVEVRGILGSFFQLCFCIGILLVDVMGAVLNWRDLSFVLAVFPVLYLIGLFFVPESRIKVKDEMIVLKPTDNKSGFVEMIKKRTNRRALTVALGLVSFQQLSGINAVIFYTSTIFQAAGSTLPPAMCTIIVAAAQLIFSCASVALIEKRNRRFYLLVSSTGMSCSLVFLAAYFHCKHSQITFPGFSFLPLCSMVLFILSYCAGFGPIPWLMMGELFCTNFKGVGCGTATMFNWCLVFLVTAIFPIVCSQLGQHNTFYIFALFNLTAAFFVVYCVPETRGKTSSQIQECF